MWQRAFSKVWAAGGTHTRVTVLGVPPWDVFPSRKLFPCLRRGLLLWEKPVHASFGFCLYSVLTPLGCLLLGGGGDFVFRFPCQSLLSVPHSPCCCPSWMGCVWEHGWSWSWDQLLSHAFPFISSASACLEHHISSAGAFQPACSASVMSSPFPLLFPHSFPALVFMG